MKEVVRRVEIPYEGKPYVLDLSNDPELLKDAQYVLRSYNALYALKKMPRLENGNFRVYSAEIPQFKRDKEGCAYHSAFIEKDPDHPEDFIVVADERLKPHERLATLAHELGHAVGKFNPSDKDAQKNAIKNLTTVLSGYEILSSPEAVESLRHQGTNFNAGDKPREEVKQALQYLTVSGKAFGVTERDWAESGLTPTSSAPKRKGLERMVSIISISVGLLILLANSFTITGNVIAETTLNSSYSVFIASLFVAMGAFILVSERFSDSQSIVK